MLARRAIRKKRRVGRSGQEGPAIPEPGLQVLETGPVWQPVSIHDTVLLFNIFPKIPLFSTVAAVSLYKNSSNTARHSTSTRERNASDKSQSHSHATQKKPSPTKPSTTPAAAAKKAPDGQDVLSFDKIKVTMHLIRTNNCILHTLSHYSRCIWLQGCNLTVLVWPNWYDQRTSFA